MINPPLSDVGPGRSSMLCGLLLCESGSAPLSFNQARRVLPTEIIKERLAVNMIGQ